MSQVQRRRFLVAASALLAAPFAADAQRAIDLRIGVLTFYPTTEVFREAFRAGLREHGYVEGQNIVLEWRSAEGRYDRANAMALELVQMKVNVIVATPTQAVQAAKGATSTIPIVMAPAGDPVGTGFVASLARPGGNITGVTTIAAELGGKLLELLKELKPTLSRVAVLVDPENPFARSILEHIQPAANSVGIRIQPVYVRRPDEFGGAFAAMVKERAGAVVIQPLLATKRVAELAIKHRLLSITSGISASTFPDLGGLVSYGANPADDYRHAAVYVDKILRGAKPADLPVEGPAKYELVVNAKTAKAIGFKPSQSFLVGVDRQIE